MTRTGQGRKRRVLPSGFSTLRDILTFFAGVAIIANEVLSDKAEYAVLGVGLTMAGLPVVFGAQERGKTSTPPAKPPPEPPAPVDLAADPPAAPSPPKPPPEPDWAEYDGGVL